MPPKNLVIELFWHFIVDKEIDNNKSILPFFILYILIGIRTDDLSILIRIETEILSGYFYDHRIDIYCYDGICEMQVIPDDIYDRSPTESEEKDILISPRRYLFQSKSHNPMKRTERIIGMIGIENLLSIY